MLCLITGSNGLLGQKIFHELTNNDYTVVLTSLGENKISNLKGYNYESLDISDRRKVSEVLKKYKPNVVFNTAAITNVDLCEEERSLCKNVNSNSVKYLADTCLEIGAHLIHISTDFIFDGEKEIYDEKDEPNPLSYYGISKLDSEKILFNHSCKWSILRTIVLFGVAENLEKNNILFWAKEKLEKGEKIKIIDDEYRSPTLAEDLAKACVKTAEKKVYGVMHISGDEMMSIFEMVERLAKFYKFDVSLIERINSKELNQKAKRPPKTCFDLTKAKKEINYSPKSFEESLKIIDTQLLKK